MSRLSLEIIEDQQVMLRDGVSLHSRKDPVREAQVWAQSQSHLLKPGLSRGPVFVLGCGAFYHIVALSELRPELTLIAVDFDTELLVHLTNYDLLLGYREALESVEKMAVMIATESLMVEAEKKLLRGKGYSVLRFRPAWTGFEKEFSELEASLLDATPEALILWFAAGKVAAGFEEIPEDTHAPLTEEEKLILALQEVVS